MKPKEAHPQESKEKIQKIKAKELKKKTTKCEKGSQIQAGETKVSTQCKRYKKCNKKKKCILPRWPMCFTDAQGYLSPLPSSVAIYSAFLIYIYIYPCNLIKTILQMAYFSKNKIYSESPLSSKNSKNYNAKKWTT